MPISKRKFGHLEVICGPMFSGKTEELIRRITKVEFTKKKTIVFKPIIDTRYSDTHIQSHNGKKIKCINIDNVNDCLEYIKEIDIFAFDEAQFYNSDIINTCKELLLKDKRIIIAGLDRDSNGKPFGQMPYILAHADYITKLNAVCVKCGDVATFSYRKSNDKEQIVLGEKEKYEARCIICFYKK
jgi:thymidine kinase